MESGIYLIKNIINNKEYVGKSKSIKIRQYKHWYLLKKGAHYNLHLQNAYNKYGKQSFCFVILEYCEEEELIIREKWWVDLLNTKHPNGYNILDPVDGPLGMKLSPETIQKRTASRKGFRLSPEHKKAIYDANKGRKRRPGTGEKISASLKGRSLSETNIYNMSKSYRLTSPIGDVIVIRNLSRFCKESKDNLNRPNMVAVASGRLPNHKGWKCERIDQ